MSFFAEAGGLGTNFGPFDTLIVVAYLSVSLVIGLVVRRFVSDMTTYIAAGRSVGRWLGLASLTGTELGLITVMYSAEKGFKGGFAAFHIAVIAGIVTFLVGATGFIIVPLRRHQVLTIPEYYGCRFGRRTQILGGLMLALGGILNMGLFLKVGSMFIVGVTGMSKHGWALPVVMTSLLALVLVYTVLGGMISVIITDYIQFVILAFGMLAATGLSIVWLGWDTIFSTVEAVKGEAGFDPFSESGVFGADYVMWMTFLGIVSCAIWPTSVARALAMEDEAAVRSSYRWSSISFTIRFLLPYFWGICALVFFMTKAPDLAERFGLGEGGANSTETAMNALYAMPIYLGKLLPTGLLGLVVAAMIAAFMSTHDSYLLCWASVIVQDIVAPLRQREFTATQRVMATRIVIVLIGIWIWAWGLFYEGGDDIWDYMAITGAIYFTGAFAVLVGGLYWRSGSSAGAFGALLAGCTAVFGLKPIRIPLGQSILSAMGRPSGVEEAEAFLTSQRVGLAAVLLTLAVFVLLSLCLPDRDEAAASVAGGGRRGEGVVG